MSIAEPGAIWRIIEAVSRPADQEIGPIQLRTADADWLRDHLLEIATATPARSGKPPKSNHYLWVAIDVAMRRLADPGKPLKTAYLDVAEFWGVKQRQIEEWEPKVRDEASSIVSRIEFGALARAVKRNRDNYRNVNGDVPG